MAVGRSEISRLLIGHIDEFLRAAVAGAHLHGKFAIVIVGKQVEAQPDLAKVVDARGALGAKLGLTEGGQQQGGENPDDGDDYQQFDQGESDDLPALPQRFHV